MRVRPRRTAIASVVALAVTAVLVSCSSHPQVKVTGPTDLPALAAQRGIEVGSMFGEPKYGKDFYRQMFVDNFTSINPGYAFKWQYMEPRQGQFDFHRADRMVAFATEHHLRVQGCCLAWHANNPAWLTSRPWTKAQLRSFLHQYVTTVVSRYRGRVAQWDVVNEGLASSTPQTGPFGVRAADDIWGRALGPGYIADAFRWAHEADPNAQLFYNDYGAEAPGAKFNAEFAMVKQLRAQGVPITGVGLQTHRPVPSGPPYYPTMRQVETVLRSFQGIGVTTELTELDQPFRLPPTVADLRLQARLFADMFKACLDVSTCTGVTVWGVYDADTYPTLRRNHLGAATLINTGGIPKPAFYAVENALRTAPGVPAAERSSPGQPA